MKLEELKSLKVTVFDFLGKTCFFQYLVSELFSHLFRVWPDQCPKKAIHNDESAIPQ